MRVKSQEQERVGKRSARQARVSFGKNVLLPPPSSIFLLPLPPPPPSPPPFSSSSLRRPKVHEASDLAAARQRAEEQDARNRGRGTWYRTRRTQGEGERVGGRDGRDGREVPDVQQRRTMQNLTVQGTGASDDGSREFVLVPPSRNFVSYSFLSSFSVFFFSLFLFSPRPVPVRPPALTRPPL